MSTLPAIRTSAASAAEPKHAALQKALSVLNSGSPAGALPEAGEAFDRPDTPDEVVTWYRSRRYNFLVLTDHNFLTSVDGLNALHGADEKFLVIPGEEVTDAFSGKPLHVNGLDVNRRVEPQHGSSVVDTLQRNVDAIRAAIRQSGMACPGGSM